MSELTTEQVLQMIQDAALGRQPVDLRRRDLSDIDLSPDTIKQCKQKYPRAINETTGGVNLHKANLERVDLGGAHLEKADLREANLKEAILVDAHLEGAWLEDARIEEAKLISAHLDGARLIGAHLEGASLANAALRGAYFYRTYLDRTRFSKGDLARKSGMTDEEALHAKPLIGEESESRWFAAKGAYLVIKNNFRSLGQYDDATWAYVKERQMERKSFFPSEAGDRWLREREEGRAAWYRECLTGFGNPDPLAPLALWLGPSPLWWLGWRLRLLLWPWAPPGVRLDRPKWLLNLAFEGLAGYGEHWWKPVGWGAVIIALFTWLYSLPGALLVAGGCPSLWDAFVFSTRSFATLSFVGLANSRLLSPDKDCGRLSRPSKPCWACPPWPW